ncbi:hypothetical protein ACNOYE_22205 [Nannocystaceae bacterium ST9]
MTPSPAIPLLSLCLLTACIDARESDTPEVFREIDRLILTNGNLVVFIDEDPSESVEIAMIEAPAKPEPGAIEQMKAAGATPAELWLSASNKALPPALAEAHSDERMAEPHAFALPEHLLEAVDEGDFRSTSFGGVWGNYDGYCDTTFASDFDTWAGAAADANSSGNVGGGASVDLFVNDKTDVWLGVCDNEPWAGNNTTSGLVLYRDITGTPTWSSLGCPGISPASFCMSIPKQNGKAMHFWSGTTYDFKASAVWSGGPTHDAMLRIRSQ